MALNVNYDDLINGQRDIESQKAKFEQAFRKLFSMTEELTSRGYVSDDSRAFSNKLKSYEGDFNEAKTILEDYSAELEAIKAAFQSAESDLSAQARDIHSI